MQYKVHSIYQPHRTGQSPESSVLKAADKAMVTLDGSGKKLELDADTIDIQGKQALKMKGQTTNLEGNIVEIKAKGSLKAEASGVAQIKGSMCKIN